MAGYDATILGVCDEADFQCGVCHKVVNDSVQLQCCDYQYCFKCYTDSIWRKMYCPVCKKALPVERNDGFKVNGMFRKIIEKKYLMCNQELPGGAKCQKIFQYHHYRSHEKAGCTDIPIQADCCGQELTRSEKQKHDLCVKELRENFERKRKKEVEEAEKKHALAIAQNERDIDEFEKELDRCRAEIKRYQTDISKKDLLIASIQNKLDKDLPLPGSLPAPLPAQQTTNETSLEVVKIGQNLPNYSVSPANTDYGFSANEDQPAKKKKIDPLLLNDNQEKSIKFSTDVTKESAAGNSSLCKKRRGPDKRLSKTGTQMSKQIARINNNNQESPKTTRIAIKEEPYFETLPRPIKREPNHSVLYFEELISQVSERREANKQKSKKRVSFSSKPLSVRIIPPNPPRPALAPEVYVAPPAASVSKKRKASSSKTRKNKANDEKSKATQRNITRKSPIVARRSNRIRSQKTAETLQNCKLQLSYM